MRSCFLFLFIAFLSVFTAACGGGSNTTPPPVRRTQPPPPPPPPELPPNPGGTFDTAEYRSNWGLQGINPIPAYEEGGTGQNTIVAVIDSGFNTTHTDLDSVYHPGSRDLIIRNSNQGLDGEDNHGAQVSGIIVAEKNGDGMHGVAFNAQLLALRGDEPGTCDSGDCELLLSDVIRGIDIAISEGVNVINLSLGGDAAPPALLDALQRAVNAGIFIVISAGNESENNPSTFANSLNVTGIRGAGLIAGAIDQNVRLASFSNKAGSSQNVYVVAPGVRVRTTGGGNTFPLVSGTSFAAPHVAGAAAVLFSLFPNLSNRDVFSILVQTATDLGIAGTDRTFGRGLINIGEAIQPLGNQTVVTSQSSSGETTEEDMDETGFGFSFAFGDAFRNMDALKSVMMLDGFRRSYMIDLNAKNIPLFTPSLSIVDVLEGRRHTQALFMPVSATEGISFSFYDPRKNLREFQEGLSMADQSQLVHEAPSSYFDGQVTEKLSVSMAYGFSPGEVLSRHTRDYRGTYDFLTAHFNATPHLSFMQKPKTTGLRHQVLEKTSFLVGTSYGNYDFSHVLPFARNHPEARVFSTFAQINRRGENYQVGVSAGIMEEKNAVLGSIATGALNLGTGARTHFIGLKGRYELPGNFHFLAQYSVGITRVNGATNSLVTDVSDFRTSTFSAALQKSGLFSLRDRIGIAVHQPLRVENGNIAFSLPTRRNFVTETFGFTNRSGGLSPSERELDLEISYRYLMPSGVKFEANFIHQFNPGHTGIFGNATGLLFRLSKRY